jgi:DNA modification methylase
MLNSVEPIVTLHLGDCLEYMRTMEAGSVDAIITDIPL